VPRFRLCTWQCAHVIGMFLYCFLFDTACGTIMFVVATAQLFPADWTGNVGQCSVRLSLFQCAYSFLCCDFISLPHLSVFSPIPPLVICPLFLTHFSSHTNTLTTSLSFFLSPSFSLSLTHTRARAHTHTHTHVIIFQIIFVQLGFSSVMPLHTG